MFASPALTQSILGIHLDGFIPTGELKEESPEVWGGGFGVDIALNFKQSPIYLGAQLGFTRYGSEVREGDHGVLGDVRVRRNNEMGQLLGLIRVVPPVKNNFQPYFDFYCGISYIYTRSVIREDARSEPFEMTLDLDDLVFSYGTGAGMELFLNEELSLDIGFKALKGSRANYLTSKSVSYDSTQEDYQFVIKKSRLDFFSINVGVKFVLSDY